MQKRNPGRRMMHLLLLTAALPVIIYPGMHAAPAAGAAVTLPAPGKITMSLDEAMKRRRTIRSFDENKSLTLREAAGILYAMQGQTHGKKRTVPSAHGVYPLGLFVAARNITGLPDGLYRMDIAAFALEPVRAGDISGELAAACMGQRVVKKAQLRVIITCAWGRLSSKMGEGGRQWGLFEAGAASQNGFLAAAAMGLNSVPVGGFDPVKLAKVLSLSGAKESPVFVCVFGRD